MDADTAIYSCDDHLDLYAVPREVWVARLSKAQAELGPHVETRDGTHVWICEARVLGRSGTGTSAAAKRLSAIGRAGIEDDGFRAGTPELRLQDMDRDGLAASVIYGPLSLGFPIVDPDLQSACFAAWNDWAVEKFNAVDPDRLCVLASSPGALPTRRPRSWSAVRRSAIGARSSARSTWMWASDYPHTDSTFPHSHVAIEETLGRLSAEDRRKVTVTNCARLYGFDHAG